MPTINNKPFNSYITTNVNNQIISTSDAIKSKLDELEKKVDAIETPPTNCQNCGAPLDANGKCQYCGAVYKTARSGNELHVIEVEHPRVRKFVAEYRINN